MAKKLGVLLVLLGALGAGGWWNYQRNLAREQAQAGPYHGYSDQQLADLAKAYEGEIRQLGQRYESRKATAHEERGGQLLGERVREFERASDRGQAIRQAGSALSTHEAALADIHAEQASRRVDPMQVLLRRLLTF
jgi:hypothetical protein